MLPLTWKSSAFPFPTKKNWNLKFTKLSFYLCGCETPSDTRERIYIENLRTQCWGECWDLKHMKYYHRENYIMRSFTQNHYGQWQNIHINCVKQVYTLKNKINSASFLVQWYSKYWQEKSDNAQCSTSSQPIAGVLASSSRLMLAVWECRHNQESQYSTGLRGEGSAWHSKLSC
jgi:hypothetical protein